jgi:predicted RNase H-like HicB family nuclease
MRYAGRIAKVDKYWAIEVPILDVITQGRSKKEAYGMIADAIETLVNKEGFKVNVYPGEGEYFEIDSDDPTTLLALLLKRKRVKHGLTLVEASKRLGSSSHNAYARYEQGKIKPTVQMFDRLLKAVSPEKEYVIVEKEKQKGSRAKVNGRSG